MSNFYNLDGIKTELNKTIAREKALLAAWENVTFPTKKDGKPFAVFSKNINGATYRSKEYVLQPGENELKVSAWADFNGYVNDEIDCYCLVKYMKDETMKSKTENYMPKQSYLEQVYKYDLDDVKKAVSNRIEYFKNRIASLEKQLLIVDKAYNDFKMTYKNAMEELEKNCMEAGNVGFSGNRNDIFYMISDTIKNRFPNC